MRTACFPRAAAAAPFSDACFEPAESSKPGSTYKVRSLQRATSSQRPSCARTCSESSSSSLLLRARGTAREARSAGGGRWAGEPRGPLPIGLPHAAQSNKRMSELAERSCSSERLNGLFPLFALGRQLAINISTSTRHTLRAVSLSPVWCLHTTCFGDLPVAAIVHMAALVLAVLLCLVAPMSVGSTAARSLLQPGGGGPGGGGGAPSTPGATSSSVCGSATTCSSTGVAYASRSLAYANGVFTGSITTNQCPTLVTTFAQASASCEMQAFPASAATYTAIGAAGVAAPLLGRVGLTLGGINIYGAWRG